MQWSPDEVPEKVQFYYLREDWKELAKLQGAAVPALLKALASDDPPGTERVGANPREDP